MWMEAVSTNTPSLIGSENVLAIAEQSEDGRHRLLLYHCVYYTSLNLIFSTKFLKLLCNQNSILILKSKYLEKIREYKLYNISVAPAPELREVSTAANYTVIEITHPDPPKGLLVTYNVTFMDDPSHYEKRDFTVEGELKQNIVIGDLNSHTTYTFIVSLAPDLPSSNRKNRKNSSYNIDS